MAANTVGIEINGKQVEVPANISVLDACKLQGIEIPTLCHHPRLKPVGKCQVCVVGVAEGADASELKLSCATKVHAGMKIDTQSSKVKSASHKALHSFLAGQVRETKLPKFTTKEMSDIMEKDKEALKDYSNPCVSRDMELCVGCTRCIRACEIQGMDILETRKNPTSAPVITNDELPLGESDCISCGQCAWYCPSGAITEQDDSQKVWDAMAQGKIMLIQTAPSTRVAVGECFGLPSGSIVTGKLVAACRKLGFKYVFDTNVGADITIMEEGSEFLERLKKGGPFPQFTSCCPAWVAMAEKKYPMLLNNLSTARSPHMHLAATLIKYWCPKVKIDRKNLFLVSLMPCTAKKEEIRRPQMFIDGLPSVDCVITTREFAAMLKQKGVNWDELKDEKYDRPFGDDTGAGALFGVTGGVMEAALRTAYELGTKKPLPKLEFNEVRGLAGLKEAVIDMDGTKLRIAVANGGKVVRELLERILKKDPKADYHFVEVMACPCGCIGGGGQPRSNDSEVMQKRAQSIYTIDERHVIRKSHENPDIKKLYAEYFEHPLSHLAHEFLHTTFKARPTVRHVIDEKTAEGGAASGEAGVTVLFGSQGGKAAAASKKIHSMLLRALKLPPQQIQLVAMDKYDPANLAKEKIVIVICSTYGEGEFPDNAVNFWKKLEDKSFAHFKDVQFAVFGLGSKQYEPNYLKAAKLLDARLAEVGGERVAPMGMGNDQDAGGYEAAFEPWIDNLFAAIGAKGGKAEGPTPPVWQVALPLISPREKVVMLPPPGFGYVHMKTNKLITLPTYDRPANYYEFALAGSGVSYRTGQHVAILPRNPTKAVADLCQLYQVDPKQRIQVTPLNKEISKSELPAILTVEELFSQYLDIQAPVTRSFLEELSYYAGDEKEKASLAELADKKNADKFKAYNNTTTFLGALLQFQSACVPLGSLISLVPFIKPRLYSIASSGRLNPDTIQLCIVKYMWKDQSSTWRNGLCSTWLMDVKVGDKIAVRVQEGILNPPANPMVPIQMIGLGTGIAPFRAFLQERQSLAKEGAKLGTCHLWFGCRYKKQDFFFEDELNEHLKSGVLTGLHMQFSHDRQKELGHLIFVQDKMKENLGETYDIVSQPGLMTYYCGPAYGIPQALLEAMKGAIASKLNAADTDALFLKIKKDFYAECF